MQQQAQDAAQQAQLAAQQAQGMYVPNNPAAATMIDPATGQPVAVPANGQMQPMQGAPMQGQPVQGQPMPGQGAPGQPAMMSAPNHSTGNADGASNR